MAEVAGGGGGGEGGRGIVEPHPHDFKYDFPVWSQIWHDCSKNSLSFEVVFF